MKNLKVTIYSTLLNTKSQLYFLLSLAVLFSVYYIFLYQKPYFLVPNSTDVITTSYNDIIDKGNSTIENFQVKDSMIVFEYQLKKGFSNPYVGIAFLPKKDTFDLSVFNRVKIELLEHSADNYLLFFITRDSAVKNKSHRLAGRHSELHVKSLPGANAIILDLKQLETPNWWYEVIGQSPTEFGEVTLNNVQSILFTSGVYPLLDAPQSISIKSITFYKNNSKALLLLALLEVLFVVFLFYLKWVQIKKNKVKSIEITYKPLEIPVGKEEDKSFLEYINANYQDSELTLTKVSNMCAIQERIISKHIADVYGCNFKTYVNKIRIEEAQRILATSSLNMSEIAYMVGFNSPSSFNKVFKKITGKSPSES